MSNHRLDTSGLSCPLPVLKTKKIVNSLSPGDILTVIATDPASYIDFDHYCHIAGHKLISHSTEADTFTYIIQIGD